MKIEAGELTEAHEGRRIIDGPEGSGILSEVSQMRSGVAVEQVIRTGTSRETSTAYVTGKLEVFELADD